MPQATSAEFQREFGRFRAIAQREPVIVTNHGREDLVILSADEYRRLKQSDRQAVLAADMPDEILALLDKVHIPEAAKAFDHEVD